MTTPRRVGVLRAACVLALAALALMVWSVVDPRPLLVVGAMSVGQGLGTLSFGAFLWVVARDLRSRGRAREEATKRMNGRFSATAAWIARTSASPTPMPSEPPRKSKGCTANK